MHVLEIETIALAALCQSTDTQPRAELFDLLESHHWQSHDHEIIFTGLRAIPGGPEQIREHLPTQLTRLGFPDIEIDAYFTCSLDQLEKVLDSLRREVDKATN